MSNGRITSQTDPYAAWFTYPNEYDTDTEHSAIGSLLPGDVITAVGGRISDSGWTHICFPNSANPYDPRRQAFDQKYCPGSGHGMSPWQKPPDVSSNQFTFLGTGPDCGELGRRF